MAVEPYVKTVWVNDSTPPISADNLNKIEQGIYDNNIYTTDANDGVVSLESDLAYAVGFYITTNLISRYFRNPAYKNNLISYNYNNGTITFNATGTQANFGLGYQGLSTDLASASDGIKVKGGDKYVMTYTANAGTAKAYWGAYDSSLHFISNSHKTTVSGEVYTCPSNAAYIICNVNLADVTSGTSYTITNISLKAVNQNDGTIIERINRAEISTSSLDEDDTHSVYGDSPLVTITVSADKKTRTIARASGTGSNLGCRIGLFMYPNVPKKVVLKINSNVEGHISQIVVSTSSANWATKITQIDNPIVHIGDNYYLLDLSSASGVNAHIWVILDNTSDEACTYVVGYEQNIPIASEFSIKNNDNLYKITWNAVGDSITQIGYYMDVIKKVSGIKFTNKGVASTTLAINNTYLTNKSIVERVLGLNGNPSMADADVWTVNGGINDVGYSSQLGALAPTGSTFDNTTVYGALQSIVENIMARREHPRLILITPTHSKVDAYSIDDYGITIEQIRKAYIDVGEYYGVPVVDLWSEGGINAFNMADVTYPTTTDKVHPNMTGARLMAMPIYTAINDILYDI